MISEPLRGLGCGQMSSRRHYSGTCVHAGVVLVKVVAHLCVEEICIAEPGFGCLYIQVCSQNLWHRHKL